MRLSSLTLVASITAVCACHSFAQSLDNLKPLDNNNLTFTSPTDGKELKYTVYPPANYKKGDKRPVLIYMHGTLARPTWQPEAMALEMYPIDIYNFFLIEPYCPPDQLCWDNFGFDKTPHVMAAQPTPGIRMTYELVNYLVKELGLDSNRIYIHGNSNGGYATWDMLVRWPNFFAAAVPVCGGTDPSKGRLLIDIPIWTFHDSLDDIVPAKGTWQMIDTIRAAGGWPITTYTKGYGHYVWCDVRSKESDVYPWLFSHTRAPLAPPAFTRPLRDQALTEGDSVDVSVDFGGSGFVAWKKNGAVMSGQKGKSVTVPRAAIADDATTYSCTITNARGTATTTMTLRVNRDTKAPELRSATATGVNQITLVFSERIDPVTGSVAASYTLSNGASVTTAAIGADPRHVVLTASGLQESASYTVTVAGVKDRAPSPNTIAANTSKSFAYTPRLPGLWYDYHLASFCSAVQVNTVTPQVTGVVNNFSIDSHTRWNGYGFFFHGLIQAPTAGEYTFYIGSDDGSILKVDGATVINNDGDHGMDEKQGRATLTAGYHAIELSYYQRGAGYGLQLQWSGPGITKQAIPDNKLWHAPLVPSDSSTTIVDRAMTTWSPADKPTIIRMISGSRPALLVPVPRATMVRAEIFDVRGALVGRASAQAGAAGMVTVPITMSHPGTYSSLVRFARVHVCGQTLVVPIDPR